MAVSGLGGNKCLDIAGGDTSDHSRLVIQKCSDSSACQQFDKEGKVYRSRLAPGQVIDAAGESLLCIPALFVCDLFLLRGLLLDIIYKVNDGRGMKVRN